MPAAKYTTHDPEGDPYFDLNGDPIFRPTPTHHKCREVVGDTYGRLVVIGHAGKSAAGRARVFCLCECETIKIVQTNDLRTKRTTSCGCLSVENLVDRSTVHGLRYHELYATHKMMKARCHSPKYHDYEKWGGRGIKVFKPWRDSLLVFAAYVEEHLGVKPTNSHSIDRIENERGYEPGNIRWASRDEQAQNTRSNVFDEVLVRGMRQAFYEGVSPTKIRRGYAPHAGYTAVNNVVRGYTWKNVPMPPYDG